MDNVDGWEGRTSLMGHLTLTSCEAKLQRGHGLECELRECSEGDDMTLAFLGAQFHIGRCEWGNLERTR